MRPENYYALAARQKTYWWHRARRRMALWLLRGYGLAVRPKWLDVGCGPGGNFKMLDSLDPESIAGVDISPIALSLARDVAPFAVLLEADVNERLPFDGTSFDVITVFNVLYHDWVRSEASVLAELGRLLRPGGLLLLTEPAFSGLAREMDEAAMARRRYRAHDFDQWIKAAGLQTCFVSYFTSFGVPILLFAKLLGRMRGGPRQATTDVDMRPLSRFANNTLLAIAIAEARLLASGLRLPFGTTLVRVAKKI